MAGLKRELKESWELLRKIEIPNPMTLDEYANILGALCLNSIAINYANPLVEFIQFAGSCGDLAGDPELRKPLQRAIAAAQDDSDANSRSPPRADWWKAGGTGDATLLLPTTLFCTLTVADQLREPVGGVHQQLRGVWR